jgi:type II secretory pathway pseudopilin PulG
MKIKHFSRTKGFTLIELLLYVSGLIILGTILITMLVQFYSIYKEIVAAPRTDRTGLLLTDRITKEIRSASSINMVESQFNNTNGVLEINSITDGTSTKKKFFVENGIAKYQEDSENPMNLSSDDFTVSNFNFYYVDTPVSEGVRFTLELAYKVENATQTKSYTGFAILRESYE